jgi:hypothetical protein
MKVDLKALELKKEKNFRARLKFIDFLVDEIKRKGKKWDKEHNAFINGLMRT